MHSSRRCWKGPAARSTVKRRSHEHDNSHRSDVSRPQRSRRIHDSGRSPTKAGGRRGRGRRSGSLGQSDRRAPRRRLWPTAAVAARCRQVSDGARQRPCRHCHGRGHRSVEVQGRRSRLRSEANLSGGDPCQPCPGQGELPVARTRRAGPSLRSLRFPTAL